VSSYQNAIEVRLNRSTLGHIDLSPPATRRVAAILPVLNEFVLRSETGKK